jgi:hypothetical protein
VLRAACDRVADRRNVRGADCAEQPGHLHPPAAASRARNSSTVTPVC